MDRPPDNNPAPAPGPSTLFPSLNLTEWMTFLVVASLLSLTNVYTVLLTGWGIGGSIIAVLVIFTTLRLFQRRRTNVATLNLGQTMGSASGYLGAMVAGYAAVKLVDPSFTVSPPWLFALFVGIGLLGVLLGASIRRYLVRYVFPSGTACAILQTTLLESQQEESSHHARQLWITAAIAGVVTLPTKLALSPAGQAIIQPLAFTRNLVLSVDPLIYGIGIVVGLRIGLGVALGGLAIPYVLKPALVQAGVDPALHGSWASWLAIAVLAMPTFATIVFTYYFGLPTSTPAGFDPQDSVYERPRRAPVVYGTIGVTALSLAAFAAHLVFGLPIIITAFVLMISWPLCIINGRVAADTDINPLPLLVFLLLTITATFVSGSTAALVGISLIGAILATVAVDMLQDYRTGFLINANPFHQTSMQFVGVVLGSAISVPFILYIDANMGFGAGTSFPAPTAEMVAAMANTFAGAGMSEGLKLTIATVSVAGCGFAFLSVWPVTARWMPSLFGAGIGLLLPLHMSLAIFAGSLCGSGISAIASYRARRREPVTPTRAERTLNQPLLIGSAILAAAAVASVLVVLVTELLGVLGVRWLFIASH